MVNIELGFAVEGDCDISIVEFNRFLYIVPLSRNKTLNGDAAVVAVVLEDNTGSSGGRIDSCMELIITSCRSIILCAAVDTSTNNMYNLMSSIALTLQLFIIIRGVEVFACSILIATPCRT